MGSSTPRTARAVRAASVSLATAALTLASAGPALASTHAAPRFKVSGIVTAVHGNRLTVLARTAQIGHRSSRNRVLTVRVSHHAHRGSAPRAAAPLTVGEAVNASGTETDGTLDATTVAVAPRPAEALMGVVDTVTGSLVTLTSRDRADGASTRHEGDGRDRPTVDVSAATFSGAATGAADLTPGMTIVVLGEEWHDTMTAAKVYAFATAPALAVGRVTAADPTAKSLTVDVAGDGGDHQGDGGDNQGATSDQSSSDSSGSGTTSTSTDSTSTDSTSTDSTSTDSTSGDGSSSSAPTAVSVDASSADVLVNGNDGQQAVTFPVPGDKVLVVGTAGSAANTITAALVFSFDGHDHGRVGHNED